MRMLNLVGKIYGKLTVIEVIVPMEHGGTKFKCLCKCGNIKIILGKQLTQGVHKSCGCSRYVEKISNHPLYQIWRGMKGRCYYEKNDSYKWYGGSGVTVCDEWKKSYVSFRDWCLSNGWVKGKQLDKDIIPKKLGIPAIIYSPEMCSIVEANENKRNSKHVKLNWDKVHEIRKSNFSDQDLSNIYGVKKSLINKVRNNKMWV